MSSPPSSASVFSPLRHADFRFLWIATLAANLGSLVQNVGAGWTMAELTPDHAMIALVQASAALPVMLLAIPAGAVADLFNRRKVMLLSNAFMALVSAALAVAAWMDRLTPWSLLSFTFLIGVGAALHMPSWQTSVRDLVARDELPKAVALNSMSFNLMRSVGPAMGGLLVSMAGAEAAFALNAVSYLALIFALARWRGASDAPSLPSENFASAVTLGLRYVALSPNLMTIILRGFLFGATAVTTLAFLPAISRDQMQAGAATYGVLLGCFGVGAIGGAVASPMLRKIWRIETIVALAFCVSAAGLTITAFASGPVSAAPGLLLAGGAWVSALSLFNVSAQLASPRWVVGRVLSIYQAATFGGMAGGSWIWGKLSMEQGVQTAMLVVAGLMLGGAALGRLRPMPDFPEVDLDPANRFHAPALRLNLKARSGPIMIMIDWRIPPAKTAAFLLEMHERRRVRLRDGAQGWSLMRDLEEPDVWVEAYHVPTWTEYLRHNQRRTRVDAENYDRLLALHQGPERPQVHRMIERRAVMDHHDMPIIDAPKTP